MSDNNEIDPERLRKEFDSIDLKYGNRPYHNPDNLEALYNKRGLSQSEIGEVYGVSQTTISRAMEKAGVEARPPMDQRDSKGIYRMQRPDFRAQYLIDNHGGCGEDETVRFYESNLVALQCAPLELVVHEDTDVDHELNSPLHINLPENLRVLLSSAHQATHSDNIQTPPESFLEWIGEEVPPELDSRETIYVQIDPSRVTESNQEAPSKECEAK